MYIFNEMDFNLVYLKIEVLTWDLMMPLIIINLV